MIFIKKMSKYILHDNFKYAHKYKEFLKIYLHLKMFGKQGNIVISFSFNSGECLFTET